MKRYALLYILCFLLSGCTSAVALGTAYNSAGKGVSKRLNSYADFDKTQKKEIKQRVSAFHQWHRQQQLPGYQKLLKQIAQSLENPDTLQKESVDQWVQNFRSFSKQLGQCSPLNNSDQLLVDLTDQQVQQITFKIRDKQIQRVREYQSETTTQRLNRRHNELVKWSKRAGVTMTPEQSHQLKVTLSNQISLTPQRHQLWQMWSDQFVDQLRTRSQPQFATDINQHIASLWNLTEQTYPKQWETNIELWSAYLYQFLKSQSPEQVRKLRKKLNTISNSLENVSSKQSQHQPRCFHSLSTAE